MAIKNIDYKKCTSCGLCMKICPMDVFRETGTILYIAYPKDCMVCQMCVIHCPGDAIHVTPERSMEIPLVY